MSLLEERQDSFGGPRSSGAPMSGLLRQLLLQDVDAAGHRIFNLDRRTFTITPAQFDALYYLSGLTDRTISKSQFKFSDGFLNGQIGYAPGAAYPGTEYIRDFAMMVRSHLERFTAAEILNHIGLFDDSKGASGEINDAVTAAGAGILAGGYAPGVIPAAIDNQYEFIDLIYQHYRKTGHTAAYTTYAGAIVTALAYPTISNDLVYITPNADALQVRIGFGFQDAIASTGYELMTSVMRYRALRQLAEMATDAGQAATATNYTTQANAIPAALETQLWDEAGDLFYNASIDNRQHSIPGSAYAVVEGCVSDAVAAQIAAKLIAGRPGNPDAAAGKGFYQDGQIRHLPADENWTRIRAGVANPAQGTYQNGAYWATFTGWVAQVIATVDEDEADKLVLELVTKFRADDITKVPIEASNSAIPYEGSITYIVSASLPMELYNEKVSPLGLGVNLGGLVNLVRGLIEFGGGGWTHSDFSTVSERGGVMLNNGTTDTPAVKWATGNDTNISMDSVPAGWRIAANLDEAGFFQLLLVDCTSLATFQLGFRAGIFARKEWVAGPASAVAAGTAGDEAYDSATGFHYICFATNSWRRAQYDAW